MSEDSIQPAVEAKMQGAGLARPTIAAFLAAVRKVQAGDFGLLAEADLQPVPELPRLEAFPEPDSRDRDLLDQLVVFKLNGGLGTGMGLDRTKSLIPVKGGQSFLDFIVRQILHLRGQTGSSAPAFLLMDSFSTQAETLQHLAKYPALADPAGLDFLQSKVPKLEATTLRPVNWPADPELEWCPPGHGDFYPSLLASGQLDRLLARGIRYAFISNSDNLGATVDLRLLAHFARSDCSFVMEVAERTAADRKGGHLARRRQTGRLLLRESAQCPKAEEAQFQDIARHRFFNTNNLWLRLDHLRAELDRQGGLLPLPLITNVKTVDPANAGSPKVLQLESAMGAAIECFPHTDAVVVPRSRFAPVKTTADLLALRSDAYRVTEDHRLVLDESRGGRPPIVDLDARHFKLMADFDRHFAAGVPSLLRCESLRVVGSVAFDPGVVCEGTVTIQTDKPAARVPAGHYRDQTVTL